MSSINISELNLVDFDAPSNFKSQRQDLTEAELINIWGGESDNDPQKLITDLDKVHNLLKNRLKELGFLVPPRVNVGCQTIWHPTLAQYLTVC